MTSERRRIEKLVASHSGAPLPVAAGDDAAVVQASGKFSVTSVDAVVDGVHFELDRWPARAIGHKAVAAALSDLAAMGARPGEIYVAAGVPTNLSEQHFDERASGIAEAAAENGATVAGGDLVASDRLWLAITVVGYADEQEALVTRAGARSGELVVVTGALGGSARALAMIESGARHDDPALQKQFKPKPRLAAGRVLAESGSGAMIDISDGLAGDAGQIAAASGVAIEIELELLPLAEGVDDPVFAAASGEEYELLATIEPSALAAAERRMAEGGLRLTTIGRVREGAGARLVAADGVEVEVGGFDHFDRPHQ
jgi:thiamine-monophosphate kinase